MCREWPVKGDVNISTFIPDLLPQRRKLMCITVEPCRLYIYSLLKLHEKVFLKWWTWERKSDDKNYSDSDSVWKQVFKFGCFMHSFLLRTFLTTL